MSQLNNPVEILKILNKSNCRECNELTCLAFAAAVFKGNKHLSECPHLESNVIERFRGKTETRKTPEQGMDEPVEQLKRKVTEIDLSSSARRLGAEFSDDKLTIKICGKNFSVDSKGNLSSDIHIHAWLSIPVLSYILNCRGNACFRKMGAIEGALKAGRNWYRLFGQRCEKTSKKRWLIFIQILFNDMLHIFNGRKVENHYQSDISLVLHPLPLVPILICYWRPRTA